MTTKKQVCGMVMIGGGLMLLVGTALMITGWMFAPYIYSMGALMFAAMQLLDNNGKKDYKSKIVRRHQILASVMFMVTGVLMFTERHNGWIVTLTIAAVFELYVAFRSPEQS